MAKRPNKPKRYAEGYTWMRPGDKAHLKQLEKGMVAEDRQSNKNDPLEEGPLTAGGYEIYSQKQMRRDEDVRRAEMATRTRMAAIKRKRAGPTNSGSNIIKAGRRPAKV
jgi:hypothetical protein